MENSPLVGVFHNLRKGKFPLLRWIPGVSLGTCIFRFKYGIILGIDLLNFEGRGNECEKKLFLKKSPWDIT